MCQMNAITMQAMNRGPVLSVISLNRQVLKICFKKCFEMIKVVDSSATDAKFYLLTFILKSVTLEYN